MSKETKDLGTSVFPFAEILQHYGQTGRVGLFTVLRDEAKSYVFLMSGIVAHAETDVLVGEPAMWDILSWIKPSYSWEDSATPAKMTMSSTVQDIILKAIQVEASGELAQIKQNATLVQKTRNLSEGAGKYIVMLSVSSAELPQFDYQIASKQVRIGRHPENDLVLPDSSVSRKHALMIINQDAILVRDLGSMNGIKVDGQPMSQGLARDGQIVSVGEVACQVSISLVSEVLSSAAVAR